LINPAQQGFPIKVGQNTTAARWAEFMCQRHGAKRVRAKTVISRMKYDVLSFWVDAKIASASTDGAITAADNVVREGLDVDGISQLAAVAVRIVRSEA